MHTRYSRKGCRACGCKAVQKHRIVPGAWGGEYVKGNVIRLCPTCHSAIHCFTDCWAQQHWKTWKPWGRVGRSKCLLVTYFREVRPNLWKFFMRHCVPRLLDAIPPSPP